MTGELYELRLTLASSAYARHTNTARVGLDTCAGCNLIRYNQLPVGSVVRPLTGQNKVRAAQGQTLVIRGEVTLTLRLAESPDTMEVDFLVVDVLVLPALLGTP